MISVQNVHKYYDPQHVLDGVSFSVGRSTVAAIVGGSGQGKSVLMRIMIGLELPDEGSVFIDNQDITVMNTAELNAVRRRFGVLFQDAALFDYLDVEENVAFPVREHLKLSTKQIRELVAEKLREVGLAGTQKKKVSELSGGMRKRVGLARAMALDPDIIFFDEPTTGLDPVTAGHIFELLCTGCREKPVTYVIISHDVRGVLEFSDEIIMIKNGRAESVSTPQEVRDNPDHVIHRFMMSKD